MDLPILHKVVADFIQGVAEFQADMGLMSESLATRDRLHLLVQLAKVRSIADAMPGLHEPTDLEAEHWDLSDAVDGACRLLGVIETQMELAEALRSDAPTMSVESFHPWVWEAAKTLWLSGHHRNAVHAAATVLDEHIQAKLGRDDLHGTALVREAFGLDDPKEGRPRLRFTGLTGQTQKSAQEGALHFAQGCFQLIRNTSAHRSAPMNQATAFEQLAALSYLARVVDFATVHEV